MNGRYTGTDGKLYTASGYEIVNRKEGSTGTSSTGGRLNGGTYTVDNAPSGGGSTTSGGSTGTSSTGGRLNGGTYFNDGGKAPGAAQGGAADFNAQIQAALDRLNNRTDTAAQSQLNALKRAQREAEEARQAAYGQNVGELERGTAEAQRQAYVQKMKSQRSIPQAMSAAGYSGGMTESTAGGLESSYQNALSTIQNQKVSELAQLQRNLQEGIAQDTSSYQSQIAQALATIQQQQYNRDLASVDLLRGLRNDQFDMEQQLAARAAEEEQARLEAQQAAQKMALRGSSWSGGSGSRTTTTKAAPTTVPDTYEQAQKMALDSNTLAPLMAFWKKRGLSEQAIASLINSYQMDSESQYYGMT